MSNAIAPAASTPSAGGAASPDAAAMDKFESLMAQRMLMNMQQGQQAMSKSMSKMTDQIKSSLQDEE